MPAQKVSPLPVSTAQYRSSSSSRRRQALYMPISIEGVRAFLASGRLRVTIRICPSLATVQFLVVMSICSAMRNPPATRSGFSLPCALRVRAFTLEHTTSLSLLCLYFGGQLLIQNPHRLIHHLLYHLP